MKTKKITGFRVENVIRDVDKSKIIASISWRSVGALTNKCLYALSWSPKDCEDKSKQLGVKIRVSLLVL